LKLLIATPATVRAGGAQSILYSFLQNLDRERIDPFVVFLAEGEFEPEVAALGVATATVPTTRLRRGGGAIRAVRSIRGLVAREEPELVLGWGPKPQIYLGPACALSGMRERCVWRATELPQAAVHRLAVTLPAAAIVCASTFVAEAHQRMRPHRPVFVSHPGLDPIPPPTDDEVSGLRDELGIAPGASVVGNVGRLVPVKRQDRILRLVAELRRRGVPAHALIVGGDVQRFAPGHERRLRRLAEDLRLEGAVTFTGHIRPVAPYLMLMDVFVSTASDEGFGAAVVEGLSLGVPMVSVDHGGPAEILVDGDSGLLVRDESDEELVAAVERVLTDRNLHQRLREGGRARFESRFNAADGASRLQGVLEQLAARSA
jgi:glycosyltransferase involved in cell wall biosynthesis